MQSLYTSVRLRPARFLFRTRQAGLRRRTLFRRLEAHLARRWCNLAHLHRARRALHLLH